MADPRITIAAIALVVVICHALLLSRRVRETEKFWLIVEYAWLSAAAAGIALGYAEIRRNEIGEATRQQEVVVETARRYAWMQANFAHMIYSGLGESETDDSRWFGYISDALELGSANMRWQHFLAQNDDLRHHEPVPKGFGRAVIPQEPTVAYKRIDRSAGDLVYQNAVGVIEQLETLQREADKLDELRSQELTPQVARLRSVMPWILTLALSLRITKITADWLRTFGSRASG
jgi:hypothetical protein